MKNLKEQNGKYYQEVEVILLASNKESKIHKERYINKLHYTNNKVITGTIETHLYFLSDDKIKEGDWYYTNMRTSEYGVHQANTERLVQIANEFKAKKIIATTDSSLTNGMTEGNVYYKSLSKPSDSFIRKYIEEYNNGRQITDVLVEYEQCKVCEGTKRHIVAMFGEVDCNYCQNNEGYEKLYREPVLKVDSDNTITITKLKDSYSRQEVIKLLNSAMIAAGNHGKRIQAYYMTDIGNPPLTPESFTNQWIKDNL